MGCRLFVAFVVLGPLNWVLAQEGAAQPKYEEVLGKLVETMGQMTKTLEMIVDEESAKANQAALKGLAETFIATRKQSEALAPPSVEERERLARNYRPQFEKGRKELIGQIARVQRVPGGNVVLQEIRGVFEKAVP